MRGSREGEDIVQSCGMVNRRVADKGLIDLAYRSGEVESIQAQIVYENDIFEAEYGLEPKLVHKPADHDRGAPVKVWASFRTKSGGYGFEVMSMDDVRTPRNTRKRTARPFRRGKRTLRKWRRRPC